MTLFLFDPQRLFYFLQIRETEIELPAVIAVFGLKSYGWRLS
jgi:hypothetical protein